MYNRDIQSIRIVGGLALGIGLVLFFLTALGALFALFAGISSDPARFARGVAAVVLGLLMATTLIGCGSDLQRIKPDAGGLENLRLVWTALFLMMLICAIASAYVIPPLSLLALIMLLLTWAIRPAVIHLTRR
jgi:succinate dehydrogenase hydrophobic anchor subunit